MEKKKITIWIARGLEESDYITLVEWWNWWKFTPPPRDFLPENGTCGIMIEDSEGTQYCAGFLYLTNSKAAWLEFIVSNPEIKDKSLRKQMLDSLITQLCYFAKDNGVEWIFTSVKNKSLIDRYSDCGFTIGSKETTEMIKQL
tara:strand:- start:880 stop:1308 length:429 start_codon:yes stop_codon:yes gene_type:complete